MAIADVVTAVADDMAVYATGITHRLGAVYLANAEDIAPRIVWVPVSETTGPAERVGANPRPLRTRNVQMSIHVWGGDTVGSGVPVTEALASLLRSSIYRVCHGYYTMDDGQWVSEHEGGQSLYGSLYVQNCTFRIPDIDVALATAIIETVTTTQTITMDGDDIDE